MIKGGNVDFSPSSISKDFWTLMTKRRQPASAFRLRNVDLSALGHQKVQPLEILVVDTLAELCPEIDWSATKVQGDGGVDFLGTGKSIRLSVKTKEILFTYTILGQVKRAGKYRRELLSDTFMRIRDSVQSIGLSVSQFLFVISARGSAIEKFATEAPRISAYLFPGVPVNVLNVDDLIWLWAQSGEKHFEVLRPAYSAKEFAFLRAFLTELAAELRVPQLRLEIGNPIGRMVIGSPFELLITLRADNVPPNQQFAVQLCPTNDIDLIRPLALVASPTLVSINDRGFAQIPLRLRARNTGSLLLGKIDIFLDSGSPSRRQPILSKQLGAVEIAPDPSFRFLGYRRSPNEAAANSLDRVADGAAAGGVEIAAVLGPGGIGKSRLIDELFNRLHSDSGIDCRLWSLVRVDHDTLRSAGSRFIKDVLFGLAFPEIRFDDSRYVDPGSAILEWIGRFVGAQRETVKEGIDNIINRSGPSNIEATAFIVLTALIARVREGPIAVHLSNMHWADAFEIDVLLELIHRLTTLEGQLPNGVLLIVEGREGEMIESRSDNDLTTEAWRRLYDFGSKCTQITLLPWSEKHSRQFVHELIENLVGHPLSEKVVEKHITDHVLTVSLGNPMQMIEHMRMLVDNGWLHVEKDGSAIFDAPKQVSGNLVELITARVEFINRSPGHSEILALLRLCAEIGLRTDPDLFSVMSNALSDARLLSTLSQWQISKTPSSSTRDFEFLHEAYRDAFRCVGWKASVGETLRRAALTRIGSASDQPPERVIAAAKLQQLDTNCDLDSIATDLEVALDQTDEPQSVIALCRELLHLPGHILDRGRGWFKLVCLLVDMLILHGNWQEALQILENAQQRLAASPEIQPYKIAKLAYRSGNLLGDTHRMKEGLEEVRNGLAVLDKSEPEGSSDEGIRIRELLNNRFGVLKWFSGRPDKGIWHQFRALRSAVKHDRGGDRELLFSCEVGMVIACRYPQRGLQLLERATELLKVLNDRCDPSYDYARVQRDMIQLLLSKTLEDGAKVRSQLFDFIRGNKKISIYAQTLGWLTLGACEFRWGDCELARVYFGEAIAGAARCRNLRLTWKAHLAYATTTAKSERATGQISHARHAGRLLVDSLDNVERTHRDYWAQTIRLPLEHARRLSCGDKGLNDTVAEIDRGAPPMWLSDWDARPHWLNHVGPPFQILHIRSGADDIFLMG